ncbi:MAG TPA: nuclear transport factor 2 family protein [Mycobacteriales bacterium]|jgi:hypothetical protein
MAGGNGNRAALERHWAASVAGDVEAEHEIYHDDVVVEYPQSGERIRGRDNIQALRAHHPSRLEFSIRRISGEGDLWVTEYVSGYDHSPVHTVSVMEFRDGKVARETQYFAEPFEAQQWRMPWVESSETPL